MAKKDKDMMDSSPKVKLSRGERIFGVCNVIILTLFTIACVYPFWYVIAASFSESNLLISHPEAILWPVGWSTEAYQYVFNLGRIWKYDYLCSDRHCNQYFYDTSGSLFPFKKESAGQDIFYYYDYVYYVLFRRYDSRIPEYSGSAFV